MNLKSLTTVCLILISSFTNYVFAQQLERTVLSPGGNTIQNSEVLLSLTIGEPLSTTQFNSEVILINGMEQPLNLSTATVINVTETDLKLYPNPAKSTIHILANRHLSEVLIMDGYGKTIRSVTINGQQKTINIEEFSAGIYFIQIKQDNTLVSTKFIKI